MVIRSARDLSSRVGGLLVEASADVHSLVLVPVDIDVVEFVATNLSADPGALHQVLGHLLDSAVRYSPPQGVITVLASGTRGGVAIAVVDEGVGVPVGMDVFEAFQRGDTEHIGVPPWIGMGLHIVRDLVEAMGGTVTGFVARRAPPRLPTRTSNGDVVERGELVAPRPKRNAAGRPSTDGQTASWAGTGATARGRRG